MPVWGEPQIVNTVTQEDNTIACEVSISKVLQFTMPVDSTTEQILIYAQNYADTINLFSSLTPDDLNTVKCALTAQSADLNLMITNVSNAATLLANGNTIMLSNKTLLAAQKERLDAIITLIGSKQ